MCRTMQHAVDTGCSDAYTPTQMETKGTNWQYSTGSASSTVPRDDWGNKESKVQVLIGAGWGPGGGEVQSWSQTEHYQAFNICLTHVYSCCPKGELAKC